MESFSLWKCVSCTSHTTHKNHMFCPKCQSELGQMMRNVNDPPFYKEGLPIYRIAPYRSAWANFIVQYKMRDRGFNLEEEKCFLENLAQFYFKDFSTKNIDGIVLLPSHPIRRVFGADLCLDWGLSLSKVLQKPLLPLLRTSKKWLFYNGKAQKDRQSPEHKRLLLNETKFKLRVDTSPKKILLIDDVMTSGASIKNAEGVLNKAGHEVISAIVLAASF